MSNTSDQLRLGRNLTRACSGAPEPLSLDCFLSKEKYGVAIENTEGQDEPRSGSDPISQKSRTDSNSNLV
jgi:hypothetical protein